MSNNRHAFYIYWYALYADSVKDLSFSLPSFAKINLVLRVLGRREDGFHEIVTLLQTISLQDALSFEPLDNGVKLACNDPNIHLDENNLIVRAARALQDELRIKHGARIELRKSIPMGGGLGGGSSNAAVALIGLSRLWSPEVSVQKLHKVAAAIGSDVPFFLQGGTALATGTGTKIETRSDLSIGPMILVTPNLQVSTQEAYAALMARSLTSEGAERILLNYRFEADGGFEMVNDFEESVFAVFPEIAKVKATLLELGATGALMSGSGASVFGIFENEETRQTALKALGERTDWRSFAVAAVSRSEYREKLGLAN